MGTITSASISKNVLKVSVYQVWCFFIKCIIDLVCRWTTVENSYLKVNKLKIEFSDNVTTDTACVTVMLVCVYKLLNITSKRILF